MEFSKIMYRDAREYEGIHRYLQWSYVRTGGAQHYHSPHKPNSFEGPSLEGLANHTRTGLLLPFSWCGTYCSSGLSAKQRVRAGLLLLFHFGRCGARDVHFGRGGSDLIAA